MIYWLFEYLMVQFFVKKQPIRIHIKAEYKRWLNCPISIELENHKLALICVPLAKSWHLYLLDSLPIEVIHQVLGEKN